MAKIIENNAGRRLIRLSTDDIVSIVREYQNIILNTQSYSEIRKKLDKNELFIPEEIN